LLVREADGCERHIAITECHFGKLELELASGKQIHSLLGYYDEGLSNRQNHC
jgi:hypothetical protein